jgi:hypothetical protein
MPRRLTAHALEIAQLNNPLAARALDLQQWGLEDMQGHDV